MRRECRERFSHYQLQRKQRSQHAPRHVRDARAIMHVGIANPLLREKNVPGIPAYAQPAVLRIWQETHLEEMVISPVIANLTNRFELMIRDCFMLFYGCWQ